MAVCEFNLDSGCNAKESLIEMANNKISLETFKEHNIKALTMKYVNSESMMWEARKIVRIISRLEADEHQSRVAPKRSRSPGSTSPSASNSSSSSSELSFDMFSSKRTVPMKVTSKPKRVIAQASRTMKPHQQESRQESAEKDRANDEKLKKFIESRKLKEQAKKAANIQKCNEVKEAVMFPAKRMKKRQLEQYAYRFK